MPSSPPGLIIQRAGKRTERARLQASSRPIRAAGSRHARSLLASHARQGHVATSKGTSWARARLATRDFLARPAGGPHDFSANGAPRSGTKSGALSAAAAQVLGMGHVRGHSRLKRPPMASLAAHMSCAKVGRNDTIPLRRFWCNIHTPLLECLIPAVCACSGAAQSRYYLHTCYRVVTAHHLTSHNLSDHE